MARSLLLFWLLGLASPAQAAPEVHVGGLLQPQALLEHEPAGTAARTLRFTPFVRRARIAVHGELSPQLNFFVQTDAPNTGLRNDWRARLMLNDLLVEFNLAPWLQIDAGLLLLPTSHAAASATPLTLGVNAPQVFFVQEVSAVAADDTIFPSQQTLRDPGLMLRGTLEAASLEYRLGITAGLTKFVGGTPINPQSVPRLTGRLVYSFFDRVAGPGFRGFFYPGVVLQEQEDGRLFSPKRLLNVGISASYQPRAIALANNDVADFGLLDADLFFDLPLGDGQQALTGQLDYAVYRLGPSVAALRHVLFAELGYRWHRLEPLAALEWVKTQNTTVGDTLYVRAGLNWWIAGHTANIKVDGGVRRQVANVVVPAAFLGIGHVAAQMFF